jgi:hypothetical protein
MALPQSNPVPLINQSTGFVAPISALQGAPKAQAKILDSYGKLPLSFEANHGQTDARVKFLSRTSRYTLFLTGDEAVVALRGSKTNTKVQMSGAAHALPSSRAESRTGGVLRMKLRHANRASKVTGVEELAGTSNYFVGNDPAKWCTNVPTYEKVKYEKIYPGIDLVYYGTQRQLEFDFIVAPGADPRRIQFEVGGARQIRTDEYGDLVLKMGEDEIRWRKPVVYQEREGKRQEIASHYSITAANRVGFEVAKYDARRPLYIDPLVYSTYLGGSDVDGGNSIAVDSAGNAYITGGTFSTDFPTVNPIQATGGGVQHVFVAKLNAAGSALIYSTYLGGNGTDYGLGIAADSAGNAYVTGLTFSTNFPTMNPLQPANAGSNDGFVTTINPTGSALVYSTYLGGGGADGGTAIALDSSGDAYVTGDTSSTDFPTTNPLQTTYGGGTFDAFVAEINPSGSALVYSTYLGGANFDGGTGIAVDSSGNAYVTGDTYSTDFPTMNALQVTYGGGGNRDAFVSEINSTGSALVYSTYLGGFGNDYGGGIAVDSSGNAYFTGHTSSTDFPTMNPLQSTPGGGSWDAVVTKISPSGAAFIYSTYLGGTGDDFGYGIAADSSGNAYVIGATGSTDFPTMNALQPANGGTQNAFVAMLNPSGSAFVYSTYFGGSGSETGNAIAADSAGNVYFTGNTSSTDFPTMNPLQPTYGGGSGDAFVAKIGNIYSSTTTVASSLNPSAFGQSVTFTATVTSQGPGTPTGTVKFSDGSTSLGTSPLSGDTATLSTTALAIGPHSIKAVYSGDFSFSTSSASLDQAVTQGTTLTLASDTNSSELGQLVTFTATIVPQYSGQASGTVTFKDGATTLGSSAVTGNVAILKTSGLGVGTHFITAFYGGDSIFTGSTSNTLSQVVTKATTATTLLSSINPSVSGKPVIFTALVSSLGGTPTGKVKYLNGTTVMATLTLTSGSAKYSTSKLPQGANSITAVYQGDSNNIGSTSAPVNQMVLPDTTTTLASSPNPSAYSEPVVFTATVTSGVGAPPDGETVTFQQGATVLGAGTLSGGTATFSISTLGVGTKSVTAVYGGDSNFGGSTSNTVKQVVIKDTTTTTLASSQNPSDFRQFVTFTASVAPQFSGTVTGTVTFYDGTTALKTASLSGGAAKFTTKKLASGTHNIKAVYNGSTIFSGSSDSLTQTVN